MWLPQPRHWSAPAAPSAHTAASPRPPARRTARAAPRVHTARRLQAQACVGPAVRAHTAARLPQTHRACAQRVRRAHMPPSQLLPLPSSALFAPQAFTRRLRAHRYAQRVLRASILRAATLPASAALQVDIQLWRAPALRTPALLVQPAATAHRPQQKHRCGAKIAGMADIVMLMLRPPPLPALLVVLVPMAPSLTPMHQPFALLAPLASIIRLRVCKLAQPAAWGRMAMLSRRPRRWLAQPAQRGSTAAWPQRQPRYCVQPAVWARTLASSQLQPAQHV